MIPAAAATTAEGETPPRFGCNDFCTGLIGLNRMGERVSELSAEERRKLLFGSDQIAP